MNLGEVARHTPSMITDVHSQSRIVLRIEGKTQSNYTKSPVLNLYICICSNSPTEIYLCVMTCPTC